MSNPQTTLPPVPREPISDKSGQMSAQWTRWIQQVQRILSYTGGIGWTMVSKAGSRLDDIEIRTHAMLQSVIGWSTGTDVAQVRHISQADGKVWQDHVEITNANPHGTDHAMLDAIAVLDPTSADDTKDRHLSDAQGKVWQDHVAIVDANPHGTDHDMLGGLGDDDHAQYLLLVGRTTGQLVKGGTGSGENLTLMSTDHSTKGKVLFGTSGYDEVNNRLGVGNSSPAHTLDITGTGAFSDNLTLPKTSGKGIRVDPSSPTFGWRDMLGAISILSPGANDPTLSVYRGNLRAFYFSNAVMNEVYMDFHIPHDHVPGTDLYLHFHWSQIVVDTGGTAGVPGVVKWQAEISYAKGHNQAAFSTPVTTSATQTASGTQYQHMLAEVQISAASPSASQIGTDALEPDGVLLVRIFRDPADGGDTLNQVPFLHYADVHLQSTSMPTKQKSPGFYT